LAAGGRSGGSPSARPRVGITPRERTTRPAAASAPSPTLHRHPGGIADKGLLVSSDRRSPRHSLRPLNDGGVQLSALGKPRRCPPEQLAGLPDLSAGDHHVLATSPPPVRSGNIRLYPVYWRRALVAGCTRSSRISTVTSRACRDRNIAWRARFIRAIEAPNVRSRWAICSVAGSLLLRSMSAFLRVIILTLTPLSTRQFSLETLALATSLSGACARCGLQHRLSYLLGRKAGRWLDAEKPLPNVLEPHAEH
jgi:hypothetical protein